MMVEIGQKAKQPYGWPYDEIAQKLLFSSTTRWLWDYTPTISIVVLLIHFTDSISDQTFSHFDSEEGKVKE